MDPRIERTHQRVRAACLRVLGERGYSGFTIETVALESGVAKSTIYRHWPDKLELISDSLNTLNVQPVPDRQNESARSQIRDLIRHLTAAFRDSILSSCIPALIEAAEQTPEVAEFLHAYSRQRRQVLVDTIRRGVESGELSPGIDPELAALALSGPVVYSRTMTPKPLTQRQADGLVDLVLGPPNLD